MTDSVRNALAELVALEDMKKGGFGSHDADGEDEYLRRNEAAWGTARAALAEPVADDSALMQILHDPENQPSQYGTVPPAPSGARAIAAEQAEDEGLWFRAETAAEAYLQQELRRLTAAVEAAPLGELPPLPEGISAGRLRAGYVVYNADQMQAYAQDAIAAQKSVPAVVEQETSLDVVRQAIEERDTFERQYYDLSERMIYKGNSVSWWHSKAMAYRSALDAVWGALKDAGIQADGNKTCAEGVRELAAAPPAQKVGAAQEPADTPAFQNFHRSLCARFGYAHDPIDWRRDQVSLEEHIAKLIAGPAPSQEQAAPSKLHPNESDPLVLWAEIAKLQAAIQGPTGYASWKDAAVHERHLRAQAECQPSPSQEQAAPIHVRTLLDWLEARYRAAGGQEGVRDLTAFCEEVMRWTERQHGIDFNRAALQADNPAVQSELTDERILMIGQRAMEKCRDTGAQHIYIAREVERHSSNRPAVQSVGGPVAWLVELEDGQYVVDDEDDVQLIDDATNHGAKVTPLYAKDEKQ